MLKTQDIKECDKIVWFFTEKKGKISTMAKGARKNKFLSPTLPFCYGEYMFFKGKSMAILKEGEVVDSFQGFLKDFDTIAYASYLCELIDISLVEEEPNEGLFKELITTFYLMKNSVGNMEILLRAFEIKLLQYTGYGLNLDFCSCCKKKIETTNYFSYQYTGGICKECQRSNGEYISYATYNTMKYLTKISLDKVYRISISEAVKEEIEKLLSNIIAQSYVRKPKSLELLNHLKRSDKNE